MFLVMRMLPTMPSSEVACLAVNSFNVGRRQVMNSGDSSWGKFLVSSYSIGWKSCFLVFFTRMGASFHLSLDSSLTQKS